MLTFLKENPLKPQDTSMENVDKTPSAQTTGQETQSTGSKKSFENPYASPQADLTTSESSQGGWLESPQKVPASHGWRWIIDATRLFLGAPWKWLAMTIIAGIILTLINFIPVIGFIPYTILSIVFGGGCLMAAKNQYDGKEVEIGYIFKGFVHNRNQLLLVGTIYLGGMILIGFLIGLSLGVGFFTMMGAGEPTPNAAENMFSNMGFAILAILVGMLLFIPLLMGVWFATPLVSLLDRKAGPSFIVSLKACLINWVPFLVYGLSFLVVGLGFMAIFSALMGFGVFFAGDQGAFSFIIPLIIGTFVGLPLFVIAALSGFTGFMDIFHKQN